MSEGSDHSFWEKLKRRHVVRVGIAYLVVGTAVGGASADFLTNLGAPDWVLPTILGVLVLGLPVALILAWAYELTPEGIVRDAPDDPEVEAVAPSAVSVTEGRKSIVVLPFDNMSPDPNDAYFSDGLTEEIITQLSYLRSLRVISRNSAMVLKNTEKDTRTIGKELNVGYVMEGSVRRSGKDLRITAQLIDAATDTHLWAETYARELEDVFEVQADIALSVADAMRASLDPRGVERIKSHPTESLDAHDAYLLGRHHLQGTTEEGMSKAKLYLERSLQLDPDYALAHLGLAWWYYWAGGVAFSLLPAKEAVPRAKAEVEKAISLDPDLGDAYGFLAIIEQGYYLGLRKGFDAAQLSVEKDFALPLHRRPRTLVSGFKASRRVNAPRSHDRVLGASPDTRISTEIAQRRS